MRRLLASTARLTVFISALVAFAGCRTEGPWLSVDPEAIAAGRKLLAVLETGQPARLESYFASHSDLLGPEPLTEDARGLVYDGESVRRFNPRARSIVEIIALGEIEILGAPQADGSVILSFVPGRYLPDAERPEFFTNEWMRKYFACRFKKVDGRWQLWMNVCFASTGGPYPPDYGLIGDGERSVARLRLEICQAFQLDRPEKVGGAQGTCFAEERL